jgi:predicted DNA-binding protein
MKAYGYKTVLIEGHTADRIKHLAEKYGQKKAKIATMVFNAGIDEVEKRLVAIEESLLDTKE